MPEFVPLAEQIVDAILESEPGLASYAGDHRFDDRLPDLSPGGVAARVSMLRDAADALSGIDPDTFDPEDQVDHAILAAVVERGLFELTDVCEHEWNPLEHNPGPLLHALLSRPFAPADERLAGLGGRLAAIPDALATARAVLRDIPHIHAETAIGQFQGTAALIRHQVPLLIAEEPGMRAAIEPSAAAALSALAEFDRWLHGRLEDAEPGRDARLGRPLWEARLWHTLDTELPAAEILSRARENVERVTAELREASAEMVGGPATDFVREHALLTLIDDPCVIEEMPEFARGVAVAYCDPPGPLETADVPTFYCIAPTPSDWPAERVESFYREYNNQMIRNLTVHEAMPGHFLQIAHSRRFRAATRVRSLGWSGPFVEGWAVYAEELMASRGFGGLPVKLQQLKMQLRMSLNAIIDQSVHCDELSEAEAMALMTDRGFQEEGEAAGKWRRALLTSTQLSTYFVGYTEVSALAAARPFGATPRAWHDAMLAHGSPPPRHLRTLLGV
jgi:hypothetical protein